MSVLAGESFKELELLTDMLIGDVNSNKDNNLVLSSGGVSYVAEVLRQIYKLLSSSNGDISNSSGRKAIISSALHPDIALVCYDELEKSLHDPHGQRLSQLCVSCLCERKDISNQEYLFYREMFSILLSELIEMVVFGAANRDYLSLLCTGLNAIYSTSTPQIRFDVTVFPWHIKAVMMDDSAMSTLVPSAAGDTPSPIATDAAYVEYCSRILENMPFERLLAKDIHTLRVFRKAGGSLGDDLSIEDDADTITSWYSRILSSVYALCESSSLLGALDENLSGAMRNMIQDGIEGRNTPSNGHQYDKFILSQCTAGLDDLKSLPKVLGLLRESFLSSTEDPWGDLIAGLFSAVWANDVHRVKMLSSLGVSVLQEGMDFQASAHLPDVQIENWDMERVGLMGCAVCQQSCGGDMVHLLGEMGCGVNGKLYHLSGDEYVTFLGYAIMNFRLTVMEALLHCGADLEATSLTISHAYNEDTDNCITHPVLLTPLQLAIEHCNVYAVSILLDRGASVRATTAHHSPLHTLVHMLHKWHRGRTYERGDRDAVHMTAEVGLKILGLLLDHGAAAGPGLYAALECLERRNRLGPDATPGYQLTSEIVASLRREAYWEKNRDFCMFLASCRFLDNAKGNSRKYTTGTECSAVIQASPSLLPHPAAAVFSNQQINQLIVSLLPICIPDPLEIYFDDQVDGDTPCGEDAGISEW